MIKKFVSLFFVLNLLIFTTNTQTSDEIFDGHCFLDQRVLEDKTIEAFRSKASLFSSDKGNSQALLQDLDDRFDQQ